MVGSKTTFIFILLILYSINSLVVESKTASEKAWDIINEYSGITRYTYFTTDQKLTKYPPGLCGGTTPLDQCNYAQYGEAVVLLAGVTLLIGGVILVTSVIFWMGRNFFFGGCQPTKGLLCPGPKLDPEVPGEGYSKCQVWTLRIVVFALALAAVPLFITAMTGNSQSTKGVSDLGDTIIAKGDDTISSIENIRSNITNTQYQRFSQYTNATMTDVISRLDDILAHGVEISTQAKDINTQVKKYSGYRNDVVLVGLIFGLAVGILVFISGLCSIPFLSFIGAMACVPIIPFMWIVFSLHYPINSVLSDVCITYNTSGVSQLSNFSNGIVNQIFQGCDEPNNTIVVFNDLNDLVMEMFTSSYNESCGDNGFGKLCNQSFPYFVNGYSAPPVPTAVINCPAVACDNTTLGQYVDSSIYDFLGGCRVPSGSNTIDCNNQLPTDCATPTDWVTCNVSLKDHIRNCSTDCANLDLRNASLVVVDGFDALKSFEGIYQRNVIPLIRCSFLIPFIKDVEDIVCVREVNSLTLLISPTGIFAILLIGTGVTAVLGSKRFNKKAHAQNSMDQEMA